MVSDMMESSIAGYPLEGLLFGGSPAPSSLVPRAQKAFPTATMIQGYGMTETNSIAVSIAGEDYIARPTSTGLPSPVNEVKIVLENICLPPGALGEVWLRGPNIMTSYWNDPAVTDKIITGDGWIKTGDLGYVDEEGFLYIKDRIKDIIIRGGENIDSVSVENALYTDPRVLEAAAVGVPDDRLGELVTAVVSVKPAFYGQVTEAALVERARERFRSSPWIWIVMLRLWRRLPRFATPVMIIVQDGPLDHTPSGKIVKDKLRQLARERWKQRLQREPRANL